MSRKSYEDDLSDPAILQKIAQRLGGYMNRDLGKIRIYGVKWSYDGGNHAYLVAKCKCGVNFVLSETTIGTAMAGGCFYCRRKAQPVKTEGLETDDGVKVKLTDDNNLAIRYNGQKALLVNCGRVNDEKSQ